MVICLEVYQNQRWWPLSKWKPGKLLPTDRSEFSSKDGREKRSLYGEAANELLPEGFVWVPQSTWALEISSSATDEEGWRYAVDFPSTYQKKMTMGCMVRRRRWWREAVLVSAEERASRLTVDCAPPMAALPPPTVEATDTPVCEDGRQTPPEDRPENYPVSSEIFDPDASVNSSNNKEVAAVVQQNACAVAAEKGERFSLPQSFSHPTTTATLDSGAAVTKDESFVLGRGSSQDADDFTAASRQHSSGVFMVPRHALVGGVTGSTPSSSANPLRSSMLAHEREESMPSPDLSGTTVKETPGTRDPSHFEVPATTIANSDGVNNITEEDADSWGGRALPPASAISPEYDDLLQHFVSQAATKE